MCFAPYLIHRAAPGTRKQKSVCIATFLRLGAVAWFSHRKSRRKSAVHQSCSGSLSPCQSGKGPLIEKKLQYRPIFCFCNGRIAETRQIRNKNLASAELGPENRTEAKRRARRTTALSICGDTRLRQCRTSGAAAYPGRPPNSTQIAPMGQNEPIKRKRPPSKIARRPAFSMVPATGIEPATH